MKMSLMLGALAAAGCGRFGFESVSSDESLDGGVDAPCQTRWRQVRVLDELNSASVDWSPAWGDGLLQIVLESDRDGDYDLFLASRDNIDARFSPPRAITELNTADPEKAPSMSRDGLELLFDQNGTIRRATRSSVRDRFNVATTDVTRGGFGGDLGGDDLRLVYGVGTQDGFIELVERVRATTTSQEFSAARALANLRLPDGGWPSLSDDGLELFYESGPASPAHTTRRADLDSPFSTPTPIAELGNVSDPEISPDGQWLLYVINASNEIALAQRECAPSP